MNFTTTLWIFTFFAMTRLAVTGAELAPLDTLLKTAWPKNRTVNIVFHGHSVPAGYHKTPDVRPFESYPHLVHQAIKARYPYAVLNGIVTAIGGENSVAGEARFEHDVLAHKPDLVLIDYALNDRRLPLDRVEAAWRGMIRQCRENGIPVVLLTPTGDSSANLANADDPLHQRAELLRRLAAEEKVLLADVSAAWLAELEAGTPEKELLSQVNHPNLRGHQLAAKVIDQTLRNAGLAP
jgi:lysophospholipase L1-like esterase